MRSAPTEQLQRVATEIIVFANQLQILKMCTVTTVLLDEKANIPF